MTVVNEAITYEIRENNKRIKLVSDGSDEAATGFNLIDLNPFPGPEMQLRTLYPGNGIDITMFESGLIIDNVQAPVPGPPGDPGEPGLAATVSIYGTNTLAAGNPASVQNLGTASAASLLFDIPEGQRGTDGAPGLGLDGLVSLDAFTVEYNEPPIVTLENMSLAFGIPRGYPGAPGEKGDPGVPGEPGAPGEPGGTGDPGLGLDGVEIATFTLEPYEQAFVTYDGEFLNFDIPRGYPGETGPPGEPGAQGGPGPQGEPGGPGLPGSAATVAVGLVTTGDSGTTAAVVNSGSEFNAIFDFIIPKGDTQFVDVVGPPGPMGPPGPPGSDAKFPTAGNLFKTADTEIEAPAIFPGSYSISQPIYSSNSVDGDMYLAYEPYNVFTDPDSGVVFYTPGKFKLYMPYGLRNLDQNLQTVQYDINAERDRNNSQDTSIGELRTVPFMTLTHGIKNYNFTALTARSLDATGTSIVVPAVSSASSTVNVFAASSPEGYFFPGWTGVRYCTVLAQINFQFISGTNDNPVAIWLHNVGAILPGNPPQPSTAIGQSISYALVKNNALTTYTGQFNAVLPITGGSYYAMVFRSLNNAVYSVTATVSMTVVYGV